jgi:dUTP pyrophosphatase
MSVNVSLPGCVLAREQLADLVYSKDRPLIRDWVSIDDQLQPNGIDLTLDRVQRLNGAGHIGMSNDDRKLPDLEDIQPDADGWFRLEPGSWHITYTEIVDLPNDVMALGRPRSSLCRSGVAIHTAVWDAGYAGRSTSLLHVMNQHGFSVQRHARVMQLVFMALAAETSDGYQGTYQGENM